MRRKLFGTLFAVVAAIAILIGVQTPAQAESRGCGSGTYCYVEQDTSSGYCDAVVEFGKTSYAYATFENYDAGWDCTGWLERSTDDGSNWYKISGYHTTYSTFVKTTDGTAQYWDGPGYLARACFHLNFSGATIHCTAGI